MDFAKIRRVAITALFSDDTLMERFALKGGNALSLIYGFTMRSSLDLDFSMDGDFDDVDDARHRIFRGLRDRFGAAGYVVFDEKMEVKPELKGPDQKPWWGGYEISFKLIDRQKHASLKDRPGKLRVNAMAIGSGEHRSFRSTSASSSIRTARRNTTSTTSRSTCIHRK